MSSFARALVVVPFALASFIAARPALAQQPGQGPPLPAAMDLKKVAVGSWAEYSMAVGQMAPMKARMALVAKNGSTMTVEMTMEGGMLAMAGGKLIMQNTVDVDPAKENTVKKIVMQIANNDPMEMPVTGAQQEQQFKKPNPKNFVKDETIKVAAGSFKTKHYRDKTAQGDTFDFWISTQVPPFGIVRIEGDKKAGGSTPGPVKLELAALGSDAKMQITKPAKPIDQQAMMRQLMGGAGAGKGAPPPGGPAPGPVK